MTEEKPTGVIFICLMLLHVLSGFAAALNCTSPTPKSLFQALEANVFSEKMFRPVKSLFEPLNVTIDVTVVEILGVEEKSQTLTLYIWQVLEWYIPDLSWDEKECGAARVSILRENIWVPDVLIAEFMDEDNSPYTPYVYLYNTGEVYEDKPIRVVCSCRLVIYTFPFDVQNCSLTFGSYLHFASDIRLFHKSTNEDLLAHSREVMNNNGEWELADITVAPIFLELYDSSYSEIRYSIILRRRPMLYVVNLLIPSCFLVTVDIFSFMLPPHSVDRSSFKMTLILGYSVFLLIMNDLLPVTGNETPLINVFFSVSLALMVTSLLETVFITNIQFSSSEDRVVPHWLSVLVLQYIAVIVCLPPKKKSNRVTVFLNPSITEPSMASSIISAKALQSISSGIASEKTSQESVLEELRNLSRDLRAIRHQMDSHLQIDKKSQDWQMIGTVIDRLLFGLYIIFMLITFITIICIWSWNNSVVV